MGLGVTEIIVIFLIVLLFFGAKRLPEVARAMGQATHEFKKAKNDIVNSVIADEPVLPTSINKEELKTSGSPVNEKKT